MRNEAGMRKAPQIGNPHPRPRFNLWGDGDDFGGGDGDDKAIPGPAPPRCYPYLYLKKSMVSLDAEKSNTVQQRI